jgi:hypothetical protein
MGCVRCGAEPVARDGVCRSCHAELFSEPPQPPVEPRPQAPPDQPTAPFDATVPPDPAAPLPDPAAPLPDPAASPDPSAYAPTAPTAPAPPTPDAGLPPLPFGLTAELSAVPDDDSAGAAPTGRPEGTEAPPSPGLPEAPPLERPQASQQPVEQSRQGDYFGAPGLDEPAGGVPSPTYGAAGPPAAAPPPGPNATRAYDFSTEWDQPPDARGSDQVPFTQAGPQPFEAAGLSGEPPGFPGAVPDHPGAGSAYAGEGPAYPGEAPALPGGAPGFAGPGVGQPGAGSAYAGEGPAFPGEAPALPGGAPGFAGPGVGQAGAGSAYAGEGPAFPGEAPAFPGGAPGFAGPGAGQPGAPFAYAGGGPPHPGEAPAHPYPGAAPQYPDGGQMYPEGEQPFIGGLQPFSEGEQPFPAASPSGDVRLWPRLLFIGGCVGVIAVALFVVLKPASAPGERPPPAAEGTSDPASGDNALPQAKEQAVTVDRLLNESKASRGGLAPAVAGVRRCANIPGAIATMQRIEGQRRDQWTRARRLAVGKLPAGGQLRAALVRSLAKSLEADTAYLAWARVVQRQGCRGRAPINVGAYRKGVAASGAASRAKVEFIGRWRPIAARYGLTPRTQDNI